MHIFIRNANGVSIIINDVYNKQQKQKQIRFNMFSVCVCVRPSERFEWNFNGPNRKFLVAYALKSDQQSTN